MSENVEQAAPVAAPTEPVVAGGDADTKGFFGITEVFVEAAVECDGFFIRI